VKAARASQKNEGFLRALRADIKEISAWISLTGVACAPDWSGRLSPAFSLIFMNIEEFLFQRTNFSALKFSYPNGFQH
jgi:hypothetical protein